MILRPRSSSTQKVDCLRWASRPTCRIASFFLLRRRQPEQRNENDNRNAPMGHFRPPSCGAFRAAGISLERLQRGTRSVLFRWSEADPRLVRPRIAVGVQRVVLTCRGVRRLHTTLGGPRVYKGGHPRQAERKSRVLRRGQVMRMADGKRQCVFSRILRLREAGRRTEDRALNKTS